jgi:hypothetical protein
MDETAKTVLTFLGTTGGSAFLLLVAKAIGKWITGAAHREQVRNSSLATRAEAAEKKRDEADGERDAADIKRREAEEHVAMLKSQIRELGAVPVERPVKE